MTDAERDQKIERHLHLVRISASRVLPVIPYTVEPEDLYTAGAIGLIHAVDHYDPSRGTEFPSWAIACIRRAIVDFLRQEDCYSRYTRDQLDALGRAECRLDRRGEAATREALAEEMGMSAEKVEHLQTLHARQTTLGLEESLAAEEFFGAESPSAFEQMLQGAQKDTLLAAVDQLPVRERGVIWLYYYEGKPFREIGEMLSLSESRAFQLHGQAITRLRRALVLDESLFVEPEHSLPRLETELSFGG